MSTRYMSEKKTVMETKGVAGTEQKVKKNIEKSMRNVSI